MQGVTSSILIAIASIGKVSLDEANLTSHAPLLAGDLSRRTKQSTKKADLQLPMKNIQDSLKEVVVLGTFITGAIKDMV